MLFSHEKAKNFAVLTWVAGSCVEHIHAISNKVDVGSYRSPLQGSS